MFIFRTARVLFCCQWHTNFGCCQRLHISRCILQKKKWTKDEINSLLEWNYATNVICGPRIQPKKVGSTASRAKREAINSSHYVSSNTSHVTDRISADKLTDSEAHMADFPCSVSKLLSPETVLEVEVEDPVEKLRAPATDSRRTATEKRQTEVNNSSSPSKHSSEESFFESAKRKDTYAYTWVDSFSRPLSDKTSGSEKNTEVSFPQSTDIGANNVQNVENVSHHKSSVTNASGGSAETSHSSDRDQSTDKISLTELEANEDKVQKSNSAQHILSFPLFTSAVLAAETVGLSGRLPSVSAILKATMSPENRLALTRWEQRMIAELGEDGFKDYQKG